MESTSKATNFDRFILVSVQRIGTYTVAKNKHEQFVPVTVRGSTVDILNNKDVCLYWSDPLVLSQPREAFNALMTEAFPALFRSESMQRPRMKKKDILAKLRLYQRLDFTYEESVRFEQVSKLKRLAEEAQRALSLFLDEAKAGGELSGTCEEVELCIVLLDDLEEDMKV